MQNFRHLTYKDGLGDLTVSRITQDRLGFIWIATYNGLYKYDGIHASYIKLHFEKENTREQIDDISYGVKNNTLWILSAGRLTALNLFTETSHYIEKPTKGGISSFFADEQGMLWVTMEEGGVYRLQDNHWEKFTPTGNQFIQRIYQKSKHQYAFLTPYQGALLYDAETKSTQTLYGPTETALSVLWDKDNEIWIGTMNGLFHWNRQTASYDRLPFQHQSGTHLLAITDMVEEGTDHIYLSTDNGLFLFDKNSQTSQRFATDQQIRNTLTCNSINSLFKDKEQTLWIGTFFGGVNYLTQNHSNFLLEDGVNSHMSGHVVSCFAEDEKGGMWMGTTDGGLSYYNSVNGNVTNYNPQNPQSAFLDFINIQSLLYDQGLLYIGMSNAGLIVYDTKTRQSQKFTTDSGKGLRNNDIRSFLKLDDGRIAIGTFGGVDIYNPETGKFTAETGIPQQMVDDIWCDAEGGLWVCGDGLGIYYRKNPHGPWAHLSEKTDFPCSAIYSIRETGSHLYFGTKGEGVLCYEKETGKIHSLLKNNLKSFAVFQIIPEDKDLWIFTTNGLYQYHLPTGKTCHFTEEDGLKSRRILVKAAYRTRKGQIYFGTVHGMNAFIPQEIRRNPHRPSTVFTHLRINNRDYATFHEKGEILQVMPYTQTVTLAHDQNNFSLEFASLSYTGKKENQYRYRISPNNEEWNYTSLNVINFNRLPPGDYDLTVCSKNSDGLWDEKGSTLKLTILPPWWLSTPMYIFYGLLLAGLMALLFLRYKRKQELRIKEIHRRKNEEIYRSKMDFFTNVIHDVRTPLTLILSPLEAIRKRKEAEPLRYELDLMHRNGKRLLQNLNQLMDFRKQEQGIDEEVHLESFDLLKHFEELCLEFEGAAYEKHIQIHLETGDVPEGTCLQTDVMMFDKIFSNLLSNALKFTTDCISIRINRHNQIWEFTVHDNGKGIPQEQQKNLFEPFYQVKEQLPVDYIGTGIGLSIVKRLVEKLHGTIRLESEAGKGTSFIVTLPEIETDSENFTQAQLTTMVRNQETKVYQKPLMENASEPRPTEEPEWIVAVVEDHTEMRDFLSSILQSQYRVQSYDHAQALLDDLPNRQFDLIVSDVMMPGMDGFTLCRTLKENEQTRYLPVILLTAKVMEADEITGLNIGADAYIRKPFSTEVLLARIRNLIENRLRISEKFRQKPETLWEEVLEKEEDRNFIDRLNHIIYRNLNNPELSVPFVAGELGICRTLFYSRMKAVSGMTFTDFVRVARLKKAVEMMQSGQYTLVEISDRLGFSSPSFFTRTFKKQFNMTPSEYLKGLDKTISSDSRKEEPNHEKGNHP